MVLTGSAHGNEMHNGIGGSTCHHDHSNGVLKGTLGHDITGLLIHLEQPLNGLSGLTASRFSDESAGEDDEYGSDMPFEPRASMAVAMVLVVYTRVGDFVVDVFLVHVLLPLRQLACEAPWDIFKVNSLQ